jgi:hypothetical protein
MIGMRYLCFLLVVEFRNLHECPVLAGLGLKCGELISYQLIDQTALEAIQSDEITVRVTDIDEVSLGLRRSARIFIVEVQGQTFRVLHHIVIVRRTPR